MSPNDDVPAPRWALLRSAQAWIALFSALGVALIAVVDVERTSPGPVTAAHALVEELAGGTSCSSCHGGVFSGMTDSCLECHAPIADQLEADEGLHGLLIEQAEAERCALCHSEHHGAEFALVNAASFSRAGIPDPTAFDHAALGFEMKGRHLELDCAECHVNADVDVLPEGEHRFLGLDPSCVRCHEDPHEGRMVRDCSDCHSQSSFEELHFVRHDRRLALVGGHRGQDCRTCHAEDDERSLEALARGLRGRAPRDCATCHESPHTDAFVAKVAERRGLGQGASCATCHLESHTQFHGDGAPEELSQREQRRRSQRLAKGAPRPAHPTSLFLADQVLPRLHAASGFGLKAPHDGLDCSVCHDPGLAEFDARHPGRRPGACSACHDDPHGGQFEAGRFAGRECTACHARTHFEPHEFDVERHAKTAFPLLDSHATTDCASCHLVPDRGFGDILEPRVFRGTEGRCEDCHEDAHMGAFESALSALAAPSTAGSCAECHLSTSFDEVLLEALGAGAGADARGAGMPFEHARWTGFTVQGAHAQGSCEACHPRSEHPDAFGRRFGRVEEHFGVVDGCETCHQDPHEGGFDVSLDGRDWMRPSDRGGPGAGHFEGRNGCLRCHVETSFRVLPHGFDHDLWTGFDLNGAHERASCTVCHAPLRTPAPSGRTWEPAAGSNCGDCHADPHASQFDEDGVTNCASCHRSAESFAELRFDHERHTRFSLRESHSEVACSSCHVAWELESGAEIVRYRPLDTDCASCHGSQEGPTLRRRGRRD